MSITTEKHKVCWEARELKKGGWVIGICIGEKVFYCGGSKPPVFATEKDVKKALKAGIVFIHGRKA